MKISRVSVFPEPPENSTKRNSLNFAGCWLLGWLLIGTFGCGPSLPETIPISGTIKLDGRPLELASISFVPESGGRFGYGTSDAEGHFKISTFGVEDGATLGRHKVLVAKVDFQRPNGSNTVANEDELERIGSWETKSMLPEKYSSATTTDLLVDVSEGIGHIELNLTGASSE